LSSHFQKIHNVSIRRGSGVPISRAMQELKPPVFFKEKESFGKQVHLWETKKTEKVFSILNNAEKEIKNSVNLGELIINDVVLRISAAAKK
jgi:DNA polymerase-3 subunit delta